METFLGVPIVVGDVVFGNVYLTEKAGSFTAEDEEMVVTLAGWAAVAIENARLHARVSERRDELEQNVAALSAMMDITVTLAGETDLDAVQELVAKRSRALVGARAVALLLASDAGLSIAATAGEYRAPASVRIQMTASVIADVVRTRRPLRVDDGQSAGRPLGLPGLEANAALVAPLLFRDRLVGVLVAADRIGAQQSFTVHDEHLLHAFGTAAATALASAQAAHAGDTTIPHDERARYAAALRSVATALGESRDAFVQDPTSGERAAVAVIAEQIETLLDLADDLAPEHVAG
jgi:GAF domain-containing protein